MSKFLFFVLVMGLVGCSKAPTANYTFYCATPVGVASGEGYFTNSNWESESKDAVFTTDSGATVRTNFSNCVAVVKK